MFPCVWGEEKVMTIYDAGPLAAGPLCGLLNFSGCRKRSAAKKGVRSLFFVFGTLSVTFRSLFLTLLSLFSSLFCQTPFAGLLLRQGEFWVLPEDYCKKGPCNFNTEMFVSKVGNPCPTLGQLLANRILYAVLVGEKQYEIARARFCTRSCSEVGQLLVNSSPAPHPKGSCRGLPCRSPLATPDN